MELENMNEEELLGEAMKQGYNPEYAGENKKSPKEYLEVSMRHNKVLKERNDRLAEQIDTLNDQMTQLVAFQNEQKQKAINKALAELNAQKKEAISDGDHQRVEEIDDQINKQTVAIKANDPILELWLQRNPWYKDNEDLGIEADIIAQQLKATGRFDGSDKDYERLLNTVEKRIKSSFSDKFKNPKKDNPAEVDSGNVSSGRQSSSKKSYADLPADAKAACDRFVANKTMTRDQYVEMYEWE